MSPRLSVSEPEAVYVPTPRVPDVETTPAEETVTAGVPLDWVKLTVPLLFEVASWSSKPELAGAVVVPVVGAIWVIVTASTVTV